MIEILGVIPTLLFLGIFAGLLLWMKILDSNMYNKFHSNEAYNFVNEMILQRNAYIDLAIRENTDDARRGAVYHSSVAAEALRLWESGKIRAVLKLKQKTTRELTELLKIGDK